mgnify:CR=1 FL=1
MNRTVSQRYRVFRRGWGTFYCQDLTSGKQDSLRTRDKTEAHRVFVAEQEVRLTALEFKLLRKLCESKDRVQTRAMLLGHVWDIEADVTTRTVDTHIKRLREKIGLAGSYIETVRGVGYRFAPLPAEPGS